jgi:hypothetical protein
LLSELLAGESTGVEIERVIGLSFHVMNGNAPNPGEGWASTGKLENRCVTVGAAEAAHAWLAPRRRRSQAIAVEGENLCSVLTRYARGFQASIAFSMALKAMASSVLTAASSEQVRNYKSELWKLSWKPSAHAVRGRLSSLPHPQQLTVCAGARTRVIHPSTEP